MMDTWINKVHVGDCRELMAEMPENSVHCVATSPPYYLLRSYDGCPDSVWPQHGRSGMGCDCDLDHSWLTDDEREPPHNRNGVGGWLGGDGRKPNSPAIEADEPSCHCEVCGAWRGQLGLEPTVDMFIEHLMLVMDEVWRVLRDDGVCFVNLGDSYAGGGRGYGSDDCKQRTNKGSLIEPFRPTGIKPKSLCLAPQRFAIAAQARGWIIRNEIIWHKCLSGGVSVYAQTQKGQMPMTIKDMYRLDPSTVKLWNGKNWSQCVGMSKQPRKGNEIEITLRNGERISCTPEHRWPVIYDEVGVKGDYVNIEAKDLAVGDVMVSTRLPQPCFSLEPSLVPDHIGWFVGLYIAEGSMSGEKIQIAAHIDDDEVWGELQMIVKDYGGSCHRHNTQGKAAAIVIHSKALLGILREYVGGRIAKDKHLKVKCWARTNAFLKHMLAGYLHGDGHYDKKNNRWRLGFTRNVSLARDLRTICARLGYRCNIKGSTATCEGKVFKTYKGEIRGPIETPHHNHKSAFEIVAINKSKATFFYDISVADEPHLFALSSGVLTHNSNPMPSSATDRCTGAHETVWVMTKQGRYFWDQEAIKEKGTYPAGTKAAKGSQERAQQQGVNARPPEYKVYDGKRNSRDVWTIPTQNCKEAHYATWPTRLVQRMILAGSSPKCCKMCGAPWVRESKPTGHVNKREPAHVPNTCPTKTDSTGWQPQNAITGNWLPTCKCEFFSLKSGVPVPIMDELRELGLL